MSYNVVIAADFGAANTGLTVHGKLFGTDGVQVGGTIITGFVEAVAGLYVYVLAAPDSQEGVLVAYDSANASLRRVAVVAPRETENSDVKTSTRGTSTLTTGDIDSRLAAYDAPTKAELDTAQTSITDAIDDLPDTASIVASIKATAIMTGVSLEDVLRNLWSATVGDSDGDDADDPASVTYKDATGAVDVTHALTDTTRRVTTA